MKFVEDIIIRPLITEKSMDMISQKKYSFEVAKDATKPEIAKAVEKMFEGADSLLALIGRFIAPVFAPLGFGDWRAATSLISGFTAKEAVISTMAVLLETNLANLGGALSEIFTPLTAVSFLVFTLLYTPCVAAVASIRRELGSKLQTLGVVLLQCTVAWICALVVYQVGGLLL